MMINDYNEWCDRFIDIQDELYAQFNLTSAPIDEDEYAECVDWCGNRISELGYDAYIDDRLIDMCDNENAHMVATAMNSILNGER